MAIPVLVSDPEKHIASDVVKVFEEKIDPELASTSFSSKQVGSDQGLRDVGERVPGPRRSAHEY